MSIAVRSPEDHPSAMSFAEYLEFEERSPIRHEWVEGHVYAMSGGTVGHDRAVLALFRLFDAEVRRRGCEVFPHNRRIRIGTALRPTASYYPDLLVRCGPPGADLHETDATMLAEVKSPSTWREDRREKALAYARLPSLVMYLIVDPVYHVIEAGTPTERGFDWEVFEEVGLISTPYGDLDVATFYGDLDVATFYADLAAP